MSPWTSNVVYVTDGEIVDAGTTNRPTQTIDGNTRYLKDRLDAASVGQALIIYGATLSSSVLPGQPVFFNNLTSQFEPALAAVVTDPTTHALVIAPSSDVIGICYCKTSATLGDIVVGGRAQISLTNSVGASPAPGRYFLSSAAAGTMTLQSPSVSIPVCFLDTSGYVYVNPLTRNFLADHVHYAISIPCVPAGTTSPPSGSDPWAITSPNTSMQGWLPASSFANAPTNAVFGYNLAADSALRAIWPPIPLSACYLLWDQGSGVGGTIVSTGNSGLASLDINGIWWFSNCQGEVPWPATYNSTSPPTQPVHTTPPTCPFPQWMTMQVVFSVAVFATNKSVVTSVRPAANSPIVLTDLNGNVATVGDLQANFNLDLTVAAGNVAGPTVLKSLTNNQFQQGLVVEQLVAGNGITLSSTQTNGSNYQGTVTVAVDTVPAAQELPAQVVKLTDAEPSNYQGVPYISFPSDRSSSVCFEYLIPPAGLPVGPTLSIRMILLGFVSGTLPTLNVSYLRLPRPTANTPVNLPATTAVTALTITTNVAVTANQYVEATSAALNVNPGDTILVYVSRNAPDGYSGDTGLVRCGAVLQGT